MTVNIGIHEEHRKAVAQKLKILLADTYTLYLKTQNFHWNVTGPNFKNLHEMFEGQYKELAGAVDEIAERIRSLGFIAPGSYREFSELANLKDAEKLGSAEDMIKELIADHEVIIQHMRGVMPGISDVDDEVSMDLFIGRMADHEKTAWMLRSSL